ncbi:MAG: hypothetical protein FWD29_08835 [Micrococcales bacterium]|nr:hypothetical protein [Micrococcales bacterium]
MNQTTIKVPAETHERLRAAAQAAGVTQGALIDAMLVAREEAEFWAGVEAIDPASAQQAVAADGDGNSDDYSLEDSMLDRRGE